MVTRPNLPGIMPIFSAARATDLCCNAFLLLLLATSGANAHGTATFWCKNTEGKLRVFIQHWHGSQSNPSSLGTIEVRDEADGSLSYPTATGVINNLNDDGIGLPGCDGGGDPTFVGGCKGYDDYAYWDFAPTCTSLLLTLFWAQVLSSSTRDVVTLTCGRSRFLP